MSSLRICYQTFEFCEVDIHVRTLRDTLQFLDVNGVAEKLGISSAEWPYFGIIWASGEVLARHMFTVEIAGKRILEVGCGIALASLVLNQRMANITSTDYHPEVEHFLIENVKLNKGEKIPFFRMDWKDQNSDLGTFDLIIGSDLLYERNHVEMLAGFIDRHARRQCEVIIVDPGRGQHARFSKKMIGLGYSHSQRKPNSSDYLIQPFNGQILSYSREYSG